MKSYVIRWSGPYTDDNYPLNKGGLYLITGFKRYDRIRDIQYIGITEKDFAQRLKNHHKKNYVTKDRLFWFGEIDADYKLKRKDLELVESLLIYFWDSPLNEKKRIYPPKETCIAINRWCKPNGELRKRMTHEGQQLHDVIMWDGEQWHLSKSLRIV